MSARWNIDPGHSRLGFSAKHLVVTTIRGQFQDFDGYLEVPGEDLSQARLEVNVRTGSITTNNEQRDGHLRTADFLDVTNHPQMTFRSTSIRPQGSAYTVAGDLTIRGVTRPVTLQAEPEGRTTDPWGNERAAFTLTGKLNRKDWNVSWNQVLEAGTLVVSEEVRLDGDITLVHKVAAPAETAG